jgi:hypothetical protein
MSWNKFCQSVHAKDLGLISMASYDNYFVRTLVDSVSKGSLWLVFMQEKYGSYLPSLSLASLLQHASPTCRCLVTIRDKAEAFIGMLVHDSFLRENWLVTSALTEDVEARIIAAHPRLTIWGPTDVKDWNWQILQPLLPLAICSTVKA